MKPTPIDPDDPFGSRPDEKPPSGWDERYWDSVRERIEIRRSDPDSSQLPRPPRPRRGGRRAAVLVGVLAAICFATLRPVGEPAGSSSSQEPTLIRVDGSEEPAVAVEWARRNGRSSAFVVFRSLEPEISFVSLPLPAAAQEPPGGTVAGPAIDRRESGRVLMQIYRGDIKTTSREVSTTTIFRDHSLIAGDGVDAARLSGEDVIDQVREIFSLEEVSSLGSSMVPLFGGVAVVDDDGREARVRLMGQPVDEHSVRLVISQQRDGEEDFATSVIARYGKTLMLAGPTSRSDGRDVMLFVCLTPLSDEIGPSRG